MADEADAKAKKAVDEAAALRGGGCSSGAGARGARLDWTRLNLVAWPGLDQAWARPGLELANLGPGARRKSRTLDWRPAGRTLRPR